MCGLVRRLFGLFFRRQDERPLALIHAGEEIAPERVLFILDSEAARVVRRRAEPSIPR